MLQPFYHGTDAKFLSLNNEQRCKLREICIFLIEGLGESIGFLFGYNEESRKKLLHSDENPELYENLKEAYCNYYEYINGCNDFEYPKDVVYLTQNPRWGIRYADMAFAFGEVGFMAYYFSKACKIMDPSWSNNEAEILIKIAEMPSQPVLIKIDILDKDKLFLEDGGEIKPFLWEKLEKGTKLGEFRYKGFIDFNSHEIIPCDENCRKWATSPEA